MAKLHTPTRPIIMRNPSVLGPPHPLPKTFKPAGVGWEHKVRDGETWQSVAHQFVVDVKALIAFNFQTTQPDHVNWYLQHITGCTETTDDKNWAFSNRASPGKIYIPGRVWNFDPKDATPPPPAPTCDDRDPYHRLLEIAPRIKGPDGQRIRKMMKVVEYVGRIRGYRYLWFYNPKPVLWYVNPHESNERRRDMTIWTNGELPFDHHAKAGYNWRTHPFQKIHEEWAGRLAANTCTTDDHLEAALIRWDQELYLSWMAVQDFKHRTEGASGKVAGPLVEKFCDHVDELSLHPQHLYWACRP